MIFTSEVPTGAAKGLSLAGYLAHRFTYHDRPTWESLILQGKVSLNGAVVSPSDAVVPGDVIAYDAGDFEEPPADLDYRIVHDDQWLLGIDKPGNLLVHRAGRSFRNNLIYQLRVVHAPPYPECHSIHRLDRETSGIVLVAKTAASQAAFGRILAAGGIHKEYCAIVVGNLQPQVIDLPIGILQGSAITYKYAVTQKGKNAVTRIVAATPLGNGMSIATIEPVTGRTHQIRVHCAAVGCPIVGDKLYGMSEGAYLSWRADAGSGRQTMRLERQALHCAALSFIHPYTQKSCRIEAPLPEDMKKMMS